MYWEKCGNEHGKPALVLHGGPGRGCSPYYLQFFDKELYQIILLDQRGCGKSVPSASDPTTEMSHNTTNHLIQDIERLREHLGIEHWLLYGASWGSTFALAYAQRYPECVTEIVLTGVTTTRQSEIDWLYQGLSRFLPAEWERFKSGVEETNDGGDIVSAYAELMNDPSETVRITAANHWCEWEDAVIGHELVEDESIYRNLPQKERLEFVRIASHYFSHGAWLTENQLIREADRLAGIPGVLIQGRLDLAGPLITAWELNKAWPESQLKIVEESGHIGDDVSKEYASEALANFA